MDVDFKTESNQLRGGSYFDDLRAVDLLQLREAVVDPFGMRSPLQQVQHVTWGTAEGGRARRGFKGVN